MKRTFPTTITDMTVEVTNSSQDEQTMGALILDNGYEHENDSYLVKAGKTYKLTDVHCPRNGTMRLYVELWDMDFPANVRVDVAYPDPNNDNAEPLTATVYDDDPGLLTSPGPGNMPEEWFLISRGDSAETGVEERRRGRFPNGPPSTWSP